MKELLLVPVGDVDTAWPHVRGFLEKPLERVAEFAIEDVYSWVMQGVWQLWVGRDTDTGEFIAAGTTEIVNYALRRVLRLGILGGRDYQELLNQFYVMEDFARRNRCTGIETLCRKGLRKWYEPKGFWHKYEVMFKDI